MIGDVSWSVVPAPYARVRDLAAQLGVSEVLAQVLVRRGFRSVDEARAFLHPDYRVHNPYLMAGMRDARRRIDKALTRGEPVAVYGDYDVDGITATFVLSRVLEELGADVRRRLPNRFTDGYGVSLTAVEELAADGVRLLVTVDCGVTARDEVARAQELGMDVIVTDHHEMEGPPPDCIVLTPKDGGYPESQLAGVGVAFKLCHALLEEPDEPLVEVPLALRSYTDVVAIGTIADMVPLLGENRILAAVGLGRLRSAPRAGLAALMEVADAKPEAVTSGLVGYRLAPRLNAAGRLEDASLALELLDADTREAALPLALRLNELNRERQVIEAAMFKEACAKVSEPAPPAIVLSSPDWHEGVVGIVASRVAERFGRPTILLSEAGDEAKGSGRSVGSFDILAAVAGSADRLLSFGGHRAACGVRLRREHVTAFRAAFVRQVAATIGDDLESAQRVDALVSGNELTLALADELELLAPHGLGNRPVSLLLRGAELHAPRRTRNGRHMQYRVRCHGASCRAIHFNVAEPHDILRPGRRDVLLSLTKNEYNGTVAAQVEVHGLAPWSNEVTDLCPAACDASCLDRARGPAFWAALLEELAPAEQDVPAPSRERIVDRRGRSPAAIVGALAAGGERVLVIVADVARRRPTLSHELVMPRLGHCGLYVQAACLHRLSAASGATIVMAGPDVATLAGPEGRRALGGFDHVVFIDPPFGGRVLADIAAACPRAWLHYAWGAEELDFAAGIRQAEYDLEASARRAWRTLRAGAGRLDEALESELVGAGPFLPAVGTLAAAFRVLREAALLRVSGTTYELVRPAAKVDIAQTTSYREWHRLFQTNDYLPSSRTARR